MLGLAPILGIAHAHGGRLPADYPAAGCFTYSDPKGDASLDNLPNDPDLDILGAALQTTDTSLKAYVKVDALSSPAMADGHRDTLKFTFNGHTFAAAGSDYGSGSGDSGSGALRDGLAQTGHAGHVDQLSVDGPALTDPNVLVAPGFVDSGLKVTFDYTNSWVVVDLPIADIQRYGGAPFTAGTALTGVQIISATDEYLVASTWDAAPDSDANGNPVGQWTVGDNACFGPPAAVLTNTGATKVQYGDTATVAAKLTDAAGSALSAQPVTFTIGRLQTTTTTNGQGIATARLSPTLVAGRYSLVTTFAGDTTAGKTSLNTPFTIAEERTLTTLSESGTAAKRVVTAIVRDDDRHAVAGQKVTWLVNGKSTGSGTTSKTGTTSIKVGPGATVKAVFARVVGKYAGSSATRKA